MQTKQMKLLPPSRAAVGRVLLVVIDLVFRFIGWKVDDLKKNVLEASTRGREGAAFR
jgi:hypothetical protein